jgi:hypothetical protein
VAVTLRPGYGVVADAPQTVRRPTAKMDPVSKTFACSKTFLQNNGANADICWENSSGIVIMDLSGGTFKFNHFRGVLFILSK